MSPKIFLLGATGFLGGDALYAIHEAHPDLEYTCLVRNSDKGAKVAAQYARVKLVYGTLDDADLLESEARKADIVLNCAACDHEGAARAVINGLKARGSDLPAYYIHTSGIAVIMYKDVETNIYGEESTKVYDDWENIKELTSLPDHAAHHKVDRVILEAGSEPSTNLQTAIVCPPTTYGIGRGPDNQDSDQIPVLAKCTLRRGAGFQVGAGKAQSGNVHIHDLAAVYLKLVEAALAGGGNATWGSEGYYLVANDKEHTWGDISRAVAKEAHKQGFIPSDEVTTLPNGEIKELYSLGLPYWGANAREKAIRARKLLDWQPRCEKIEDSIPEAVTREAKALGLVVGHAAKVTADG